MTAKKKTPARKTTPAEASKKTPAKKKDESQSRLIVVPALKRFRTDITVRGLEGSMLITHRWSEKAKKEMRDTQMKLKLSKQRTAKNPGGDFLFSMYCLGPYPKTPAVPGIGQDIYKEPLKIAHSYKYGFGFPVIGFKAAMVRAGKILGLVMKDLQTAFHVTGDVIVDGVPLVRLSPPSGRKKTFDNIEMREDMVRLNGKAADLRYRAGFPTWQTTIHIEHDPADINVENLVNLLNHAGSKVGVGEWRPERNGIFGTFEVVGADSRRI